MQRKSPGRSGSYLGKVGMHSQRERPSEMLHREDTGSVPQMQENAQEGGMAEEEASRKPPELDTKEGILRAGLLHKSSQSQEKQK